MLLAKRGAGAVERPAELPQAAERDLPAEGLPAERRAEAGAGLREPAARAVLLRPLDEVVRHRGSDERVVAMAEVPVHRLVELPRLRELLLLGERRVEAARVVAVHAHHLVEVADRAALRM